MKLDTLRVAIQYFPIKSDLMKQYSYTAQEAAKTITDLRAMHPELLHSFILWFRVEQGSDAEKALLNSISAGGVSLDEIMKRFGLDPYAGFLALDWILEDPDAALYTMQKPLARLEISQKMEDRLREIAQKRGIDLDKDESVPEDTSDLVDPVADGKTEDGFRHAD